MAWPSMFRSTPNGDRVEGHVSETDKNIITGTIYKTSKTQTNEMLIDTPEYLQSMGIGVFQFHRSFDLALENWNEDDFLLADWFNILERILDFVQAQSVLVYAV